MQRLVHSMFAVVLLAAFPAAAVVNPYVDSITNRNMFGLKTPPTAEELAAQNVKPAEPLPKIYLTGITTLMGGKMALLRVQRPAKPPEPAKEIPLILGEGGPAEEEVQVLEINVAAGTVKITNRGTPQELDITKDSPKAAPAPTGAPAGAPGLRPGMPVPMPASAVPPPGGGIPIPPRPVRTSEGASAPSNTSPGSSVSAPPPGVISARDLVRSANITPEEQTILIEAQRLEGGPTAAILPITQLTEEIQKEQEQAPY